MRCQPDPVGLWGERTAAGSAGLAEEKGGSQGERAGEDAWTDRL
jgi:hypothetical protein